LSDDQLTSAARLRWNIMDSATFSWLRICESHNHPA
jgi:hypothetical protein